MGNDLGQCFPKRQILTVGVQRICDNMAHLACAMRPE